VKESLKNWSAHEDMSKITVEPFSSPIHHLPFLVLFCTCKLTFVTLTMTAVTTDSDILYHSSLFEKKIFCNCHKKREDRGQKCRRKKRDESRPMSECPRLLVQLLCTTSSDHQETARRCIDCLRCHWSHVHCPSMILASPQIRAQLNRSMATARISITACQSTKSNHSLCAALLRLITKHSNLMKM